MNIKQIVLRPSDEAIIGLGINGELYIYIDDVWQPYTDK